jgi:hypothetical protein
MIAELDQVVLVKDLPDRMLRAGDVGTVVHAYRGGSAFEIEFLTMQGRTICVVTLPADDVRPIGEREIAHAREVA